MSYHKSPFLYQSRPPAALLPIVALCLIVLPFLLAACSPVQPAAIQQDEAAPTGTQAAAQTGWRIPPRNRQNWLENISFESFSLDEGLSQSVVTSMLQDSQGFMWLGTQDGLNRFDGYEFVVYKYDPAQPYSLGHNFVQDLHEDSNGTMWIATLGGGLNRYEPTTGHFIRYRADPNRPFSLSDNNIQDLYEDTSGILWLGTATGGLNRYDPQTERFTSYQTNPADPTTISSNNITSIVEDSDGNLWLGTTGAGLNKFDPQTGQFTRFQNDPQDPESFPSNALQALYMDQQGILWIGTLANGLVSLDPATEQFINYQNDPSDPLSIGDNFVQAFLEDSHGTFWIGTSVSGLNRLERESGKFYRYPNDPTNPNSLNNSSVVSIYEDRAGVLWVGTFGGGVNKSDPNQYKFINYRYNPQDPNSLSSNFIWSILEDSQGILWVGTVPAGLNRLDRKTGQWERFTNDLNDPESLPNNSIWSLLEDRQGGLWIGTTVGLIYYDLQTEIFTQYQAPITFDMLQDQDGAIWFTTGGNGLGKLDPESGEITYYTNNPDDPNSVSDNFLVGLLQDRDGFMWVGTVNAGLNRFDPRQGLFTRFQNNPDDPTSLSNNYVLSIYQDRAGTLWVGSAGGGLSKFDPETGAFTLYTEKDGLPNDTIYGILEDDQGQLWLSTNKGLGRFDPLSGETSSYDRRDGLQSNEFNQGAYFRSSSGEMFFGGVNGLNAFYPEDVQDNPYLPPVVVTDFQLFNESVPVGEGSPLSQPIENTLQIDLTYREDFIGFEFAALHYAVPDNIQYAFMMEGLDKDWNYVGNRRFASYTNVPSGDYTFRVKATNADGIWNEEGVRIGIAITPPFWETLWFRVSAAALVIGGISGVFYLRMRAVEAQRRHLEILVGERTAELQDTLIQLKRSKEAAEAANRAKSIFLANISHELRTPLNAILGFSQLMIRTAGSDGELTPEQRENLQVINRSGEHLLGLINDVLEMSKIEAGRTTLNQKSFDLYRMLRGLEEMFRLRAEDKNLSFEFEIDPAVPRYICTDEGKLRQVIMNLLGNGVKFTQEGGIVLHAHIDPQPGSLEEIECEGEADNIHLLVIDVEDTGPGIAPEELEIIFDPFVQSTSGVQAQEGTGLGLSISLQFAQLMHGTLTATSVLDQGTIFSLRIPVQVVSAEAIQGSSLKKQVVRLAEGQPTYRILVVDDKEVNRQLLIKLLSPLGFEVNEAENGQQGLQIWETWQPHLVLMDMRMPVMDGYEATRRIKGTLKGQATVVIALTASALEEDRALILSEGCDDYIRKPFRENELFATFEKHLGVQFVYEDTAQQGLPPAPQRQAEKKPSSGKQERVWLVERLTALPSKDLDRLAIVTRLGYIDQIMDAIQDIAMLDLHLAQALADLADNYEHDKILALVAQAGSTE